MKPNSFERYNMWHILLLVLVAASAEETTETDGEASRKVLGSSVVTSVSVIMDAGNGSKIYADAAGKPMNKPHKSGDIASPIELLNPDRYEFYTFNDDGDLVKRLMTLEEIHDIIATGDGDGFTIDALTSNGFVPEKRVNDVVNNVQNVLKEEIKMHKNPEKPLLDTPDVSDSWSMILPAVFGNSGEDIKPEAPASHVTPDTIMMEPATNFITKQTTTTTITSVEEADDNDIPSTKENVKPGLVSKGTKRPVKVTTRPKTTTTTPTITRTVPTTPTTTRNVPTTTLAPNSTTSTGTLTPTTTTPTQTSTTTPAQISTTSTQISTTPNEAFKSTTISTQTTFLSTSAQTPAATSTAPTATIFTTTVNSSLKDSTPQESTQYEKIVALVESTTDTPSTTTTTDFPTTSTVTAPTSDFPESTTEFPTSTTDVLESSSTYAPFSTFFLINDKYPDLTTTTINKDSQTTLLDQYLLTSTNIYEINSELEGTTTKFTNPTDTPSTTTTFVDNIEQLIQQASGTPGPAVEDDHQAAMVQEMMERSGNKTMPELVEESATLASNLVGVVEETSTVASTTDDADLLSESVGSLLSQVYWQGQTTQEVDTTTTTTTTEEYAPHIINITIIGRNQSKPAKSDLSLEMDYEELVQELRKNASFAEEATTTETSTTTDDETNLDVVVTINESNKTDSDYTWTLVSTISPHNEIVKESTTETTVTTTTLAPPPVDLVPKPMQGFGLEDSTAKLDTDIFQFVQLCNELAFGFWKSATTGLSAARSVVVSPFAATSLLAMVFLGARGGTSGEMNEILKLDDMVTFNPHLIFKNVSESIEATPDSGVATSAIVRELYSDRSKGKLLSFYKERVRQFYDGHVEEASFREIGDVVRRRTNLLVKKNTNGKVVEFVRDGSIKPRPPLAGVSASVFHTDCSQSSTEGRDGELHFVVLPSMRQRRLVPIPATVYRSGFLAGYEPSLDATAASLGTKDQTISTIFVIPGQQGSSAPGDGLSRLEKRLVESAFKKGAWSRLLRSLIPRPGLELQVPRFQHRSLINATQSLRRMGLHDLFDSKKADLKGLNGAAHDFYLSDVLQVNEFATCGEKRIGGEAHHRELYPASAERKNRMLEWEEPRDYQRAFHDPLHDPNHLSLPLSQRPRQARLPETPRLRFDRPFLYIVRHNPSGLILHMGRFHPRLLP